MMRNDYNTVLFSGYAKIPRNSPYFGEEVKEIGCVIEVDMDTNSIHDCDFGTVKPLTKNFLRKYIVGYNLEQGIEPLSQVLRQRCQLVAKNAIIKSVEVAYGKYLDYKKNHPTM